MKKTTICRLIFLAFMIFIASISMVKGQAPPPPGGHGRNGNQGAGGAAPIDGGVAMLVLSGIGYGGYKLVRRWRSK